MSNKSCRTFCSNVWGIFINDQVGAEGLKTDAGLLTLLPKNQTKGKKWQPVLFSYGTAPYFTHPSHFTLFLCLTGTTYKVLMCTCLHRFAPLNCPAPLRKKKNDTSYNNHAVQKMAYKRCAVRTAGI